jgi:glycosyltransferase involved in cell wall biosynthesis
MDLGFIYIDLTTLARWKGTLTGIQRCQKIYATYALDYVANARFTLFDPQALCYRHLSREHARQILAGSLRADMLVLPDINQHRLHFVDRLPAAFRPAYWWVTKTRRRLLAKLESIRFENPNGPRGRWASKLQNRLIKTREQLEYFQPNGSRIDRPVFSVLVGLPVEFQPDDVVIAMQNDWAHTDIQAIATQKQTTDWRHVILCHDLIPVLFPQWYDKADVDGFISYYDKAFAIADRVIFTSKCTQGDAAAYCRERGLKLAPGSVVPMGADFAESRAAVLLPRQLIRGKFALFVSTIEPRKNHAMLVDAWRKLAASGLIEETGFKLVFAGKFGWHMQEFLRSLANDGLTRDSIIHISGADDALISRLYEDAAFCLYPPLYEGFGLPIVEALAHGKALIVSSAGPMPEIAAGFALVLDPGDTDGWGEAIANWIRQPEEAERQALRALKDYKPVTWELSSRRFFEAALAPFPPKEQS